MRAFCHTCRGSNRVDSGFTLIELMITVVVAGILAAIAIPSYQQYMMKTRREDARTTLAAMVQAQERIRASSAAYSSDASVLMGGAAEATATSAKGYYVMTITDLTPAVNYVSGYEIHAKPPETSTQYGDAQCRDIFVRMQGGTLSYRDGNMSSTATSSPCWPQ